MYVSLEHVQAHSTIYGHKVEVLQHAMNLHFQRHTSEVEKPAPPTLPKAAWKLELFCRALRDARREVGKYPNLFTGFESARAIDDDRWRNRHGELVESPGGTLRTRRRGRR